MIRKKRKGKERKGKKTKNTKKGKKGKSYVNPFVYKLLNILFTIIKNLEVTLTPHVIRTSIICKQIIFVQKCYACKKESSLYKITKIMAKKVKD